MTDLLVIVPSRGRPESVARVVEAWDATGAWDDCAAMVLAVDADDPQIAGYRRCADDRAGDGKLWWLHESPTWRPMVHKLNAAAVLLADQAPALAFAGDDHLPRSEGWAGRYVEELRSMGTGIVYGDDLIHGAHLPTQWAMTSNIVRALGRMVPADVEHLYCDNVILDLGTAAGRIRYLPDVVIEHLHPTAGTAEWDDQYRRVNSPAMYERDREAYVRFRDHELPAAVTVVKALLR